MNENEEILKIVIGQWTNDAIPESVEGIPAITSDTLFGILYEIRKYYKRVHGRLVTTRPHDPIIDNAEGERVRGPITEEDKHKVFLIGYKVGIQDTEYGLDFDELFGSIG